MTARKLLGLLFILTVAPSLAAPRYPSPQGWVTDAAGVLDSPSRQTLEKQLSDLERATSIEIAVVTVPSLEGESVETYANGLFSRWRIGKKGRDNGVLVLVAPSEHKTRIEVGYGLEPVLPDGLCGEIIRNEMIPNFRQGLYGQGLGAGVSALEQVLTKGASGEPVPLRSPIPGLGARALARLIPLFLFTAFVSLTFFFVLLAALLFFWLPSPFRVFSLLLIPLGLMLDVSRFRSRRGRFYGGGYYGGFGGFGGGGFSGGGFGGFGGGFSGGGGASGGW